MILSKDNRYCLIERAVLGTSHVLLLWGQVRHLRWHLFWDRATTIPDPGGHPLLTFLARYFVDGIYRCCYSLTIEVALLEFISGRDLLLHAEPFVAIPLVDLFGWGSQGIWVGGGVPHGSGDQRFNRLDDTGCGRAIGHFDDILMMPRARGIYDLCRPAEMFVVFFQNRPICHHACKAGVNF
jgi:hypothetical protein